MRLAGILVALALVALAALQSIVGSSSDSVAEDSIVVATNDICMVEAVTRPVLRTETRQIVTTPAHQSLIVTNAVFGTRSETVIVTPEHRAGATFFTEQKRIIVSEPTRRLRAVDPVFEVAPDPEDRSVTRFHVAGGKLIEETHSLPPLPQSRIVAKKARIEAVRVNAGLRMIDTQVIDKDGDGDTVPAETVEIEVRTVEAQPSVETREVAAVTETVETETVETPSRRIQIEALCTIADRRALIRRIQATLADKGIDTGNDGEWNPATIDGVAAAQAEATDLVSPNLLIQTLRIWLPDIKLPIS